LPGIRQERRRMVRRNFSLLRTCLLMAGALVLAGDAGTVQSAAGPHDVAAIGRAALVSRVATAANGPASFADLAEKVVPAVIGVRTKSAVPNDSQHRGGSPSGRLFEFGTPQGAPEQGDDPEPGQVTTEGSGFFISPDGYAVTNGHVLQSSDT